MKKQNPKQKGIKGPEFHRNEIRLKLLIALPSFQQDVRDIRKKFGIEPNKLANDKAYEKWYDKTIIEKTDSVLSSSAYRTAQKKLNNIKDHGEFLKQRWELAERVPLFRLRHRIEMLGEKYKLPAHFYNKNSSIGLSGYLIRNKIWPPLNNWAIEPDPKSEKGKTRWLSIKTYAPLSKKEIKEATKWLASLQKSYFPKGITITERIRNNFDRDLSAFEELVLERKHKPMKKKGYKKGSYLAIVANNKTQSVSEKEMRKLEKLHPNYIIVAFDEITAREVAQKNKMKPAAVRQAIKGVCELIKNYFGEEFIPKY